MSLRSKDQSLSTALMFVSDSGVFLLLDPFLQVQSFSLPLLLLRFS